MSDWLRREGGPGGLLNNPPVQPRAPDHGFGLFERRYPTVVDDRDPPVRELACQCVIHQPFDEPRPRSDICERLARKKRYEPLDRHQAGGPDNRGCSKQGRGEPQHDLAARQNLHGSDIEDGIGRSDQHESPQKFRGLTPDCLGCRRNGHIPRSRKLPCRSGQVGEGVSLRLDVQFRDGKYLANVKPLLNI